MSEPGLELSPTHYWGTWSYWVTSTARWLWCQYSPSSR